MRLTAARTCPINEGNLGIVPRQLARMGVEFESFEHPYRVRWRTPTKATAAPHARIGPGALSDRHGQEPSQRVPDWLQGKSFKAGCLSFQM